MTSPFLGGQSEDPLSNLLRVLQLQELVRRRGTEQADALISGNKPGTSVARIGLTPKQQKAKFGKTVDPNFTPKPATAEDTASDQLNTFLRSAPPELVNTLSASMASRLAGVPQITTAAGLSSQARANESTSKAGEITAATGVTEAKTKQALAENTHAQVAQALASLQNWTPEARTALAEKTGLGTTQGEVQNQVLGERVKNEVQRSILQASADPKNDLNVALKTYTGVGLGGAMAAAGLGLTSVLNSIADQMTTQMKSGVLLAAELEKQMNQADTQWAQKTAESLGGKATPRSILNWKRWREAGGDPKIMPRDVSPALDAALETANTAGFRAFLADAAQKGDPDAATAMQLVHAAVNIKDSNTLQAVSELVARLRARIVMGQTVGPRPNNDPQAASLWDKQAQFIQDHTPTLKANSFLGMDFGVDLSKPKGQGFTPGLGTGRMMPPNAVQPAGGGTTMPPGGPQMQDLNPDDAQKIQAILNAIKQFSLQQPGIAGPAAPTAPARP